MWAFLCEWTILGKILHRPALNRSPQRIHFFVSNFRQTCRKVSTSLGRFPTACNTPVHRKLLGLWNSTCRPRGEVYVLVVRASRCWLPLRCPSRSIYGFASDRVLHWPLHRPPAEPLDCICLSDDQRLIFLSSPSIPPGRLHPISLYVCDCFHRHVSVSYPASELVRTKESAVFRSVSFMLACPSNHSRCPTLGADATRWSRPPAPRFSFKLSFLPPCSHAFPAPSAPLDLVIFLLSCCRSSFIDQPANCGQRLQWNGVFFYEERFAKEPRASCAYGRPQRRCRCILEGSLTKGGPQSACEIAVRLQAQLTLEIFFL